MLEGIVFDFDGLILDTEGPQYDGWRSVYERFGLDLPIDRWVEVLGRPAWMFDFHTRLEELGDPAYDREAIDAERRKSVRSRIDASDLMPGVRDLVAQARSKGLRLSIASGSDREWVAGYLEKHGLIDAFPILVTREETTRHKPEPDPFAEACRRMGLPPQRCLALEDSPNGIRSAAAAGLYAVAVPNRVTAGQSFDEADRIVESLETVDLHEVAAAMGERVRA
ncbi:HAD family hydrolase [Mucisphaera calidilacus]|uniref:Fructose-1-phosphate phosphatase YqaB n=1 Tax=Mucisphaera calidilacus TaxID=2527982 RepID=A0A518C0B8_9BACT|nr:HAD family phosphatase [Mucisphaera calidilacus]QDU72664.1 Fructose-1-phosphate phosphatase YqaB [Mucisphaera calidilacus]